MRIVSPGTPSSLSLGLAGTAATPSRRRRAPTGPARVPAARRRAGDDDVPAARRRSPGTRFPARPATSSSSRRAAPSATTRIVYDNQTLVTPVEAPPLTLPWITGSPHALYARVRATSSRADAVEPTFGFDVTPPAPPTPLPSYPGLLRWTPVEGADCVPGLADRHPAKIGDRPARTSSTSASSTPSTRSQQWIGTVRWRVRALRDDV